MNDVLTGNPEEITRKLAYEHWERRGRPIGSPEIDWSAAEKALASSPGYSQDGFSLSSFRVEPDEGPYR
jgi:hypothetical protein